MSAGRWRNVYRGQERGDIIVDENYTATKLQGKWGRRRRYDNTLHANLNEYGTLRFIAFAGLVGKPEFQVCRLAEIHWSNGAVWKKLGPL